MKHKIIVGLILLATVVFVGIPRIKSVNIGLPYSQFWDEPKITQGALNGLKNIFDEDNNSNFLPYSSEVVYGGFIRYTVMLQDAIYFQYVRFTDPEVSSLADIKTNVNGEQVLAISHPGFYYWNRVYHASLSILAFVIAFLTIKRMYNVEYGILAVLVLAGNFYFFNTSYVFVTNVPLATMTIICIYFAIEYNYTKKYKYLLWSLVFSGFSMATKMTGAATVLIPFIAGLNNYNYLKKGTLLKTIKKAFYLGLIPLGLFILFTPSIYLDPTNFFHWVRWLSNLYKTGGLHTTMEPGLDHLLFQINSLVKNHGLSFSILALIGIVTGLSGIVDIKATKSKFLSSNTLILFLFPIIFLLYVTFQYKISYHRNFILFYPILTVLTVMGVAFIVNSFLLISSKLRNWSTWIVLLISVIVFIEYIPKFKVIYATSEKNHLSRDTRSQAASLFGSIADKPFHLGIENGLKMSYYDLKNYRNHYAFFNISDFDSAFLGFTHLLVPDYQFKNGELQAYPDSVINKINHQVNENIITTIEGSKLDYYHYMALWTPIVSPTVKIVKASDYPPPLIEEYLAPIFNYPQIEVLDMHPDLIYLGILEEGSYTLTYEVSGSPALGEFPYVELSINKLPLDTIFITSKKYVSGVVSFEVQEPMKHRVEVRLINDYWNAETGEDRNAYFRSFSLKKELDNND